MYKITQKPIPTTNYRTGRNGHVPIAIVNHRMVGYLTGTDRHFADPSVETSTHFGIGTRFAGGPVEISQYVDLANTAYGNGNYSSSGGWTLVRKGSDGSIINPNYYTVSIEHQDGGTAERGVVNNEIKAASLWLQHILLTGDLDLYSLVGIKCSSSAVASALGNVAPGTETIIDHNRISGTLKPYCWRPWLDDAGFLPWKATILPLLVDGRMTFDELMALLKAEHDRELAAKEAELQTARTAANAANSAKVEAERQLSLANQKITNAKNALA